MINFDFPGAMFLLVLLLPIVWAFIYLYRYRKRILDAFASEQVLARVVIPRSTALYWLRIVLIAGSFAAAVIALMGPKGNERYAGAAQRPPVAKKAAGKATLRMKMHEVIFLIDTSASMGIGDTEGGKKRLETAKEIADAVISRLRGQSVSIYPFTSVPIRAVPPTMDYFFARLMLKQIGINEGETAGTNIEAALEMVREKYLANPTAATKSVILLSDGGDTRLAGIGKEQRKSVIDEIISPLKGAESSHLSVYAVAIGANTPSQVPGVTFQGKPVESAVDEGVMRMIGLNASGGVLSTETASSFRIAEELSRVISRADEYVDAAAGSAAMEAPPAVTIYDPYFQIPLAAALLALALALLLPETVVKVPEQLKRIEEG